MPDGSGWYWEMNTYQSSALATIPASPTHVEPPAASYDLVATQPAEMRESQTRLIEWCRWRIGEMIREAAELKEAYELALKNKWKASTLKRHAELAAKRVVYYEKILAALEAGYCIVPDFPVDIFAIRTDRTNPKAKWHFGTYEAGQWHFMQEAAKLPVGEGDYKNPNPLVETNVDEIEDGAQTKKHYAEHATGFDDLIFPIQMAKPSIMEATSRAMALKIFDQFGLFARGTGDPIITGEIIAPDNTGKLPENMKRVSFIIAWRINVRDL